MIVVWRVTEKCNLACGFCAYDRRLPFERREVDEALVRRFAPVLSAYQGITGDKVLLSWIGGEPLLWKPFFDLTRWLNQTLGLAISTTTNGTTLHLPRVRSAILEHLAELTFSIDGLAEFHDGVRGWRGGGERLKASAVELARQRNAQGSRLKLRANVVLMHQNLAQLEALCDELGDWGIDEITFNQLGGRDRPEYFARHRLTEADAQMLENLLPSLRQKLALRNVELCANPSYMERIKASTANRKLSVSDCAAGQRFLFIDENGLVSPCNFTTVDFGIPLEEITCAEDVLALPERFAALQRCTQHAACQDCPSTQVFAKFER